MVEKLNRIESFIWKAVQEEGRIGLLNGLSGNLLFYKHLLESNYFNSKDKLEDKIIFIVGKLDEIISVESVLPTMCSGLAGYGIALSQCRSLVDVSEVYFEGLDDLLEDALEIEEKENNYDLLHGAAGISLYFVERYWSTKNPKHHNLLNKYYSTLLKKLIHTPKDIIETLELDGSKAYYFGLAHGIAGVLSHILFLSNVLQYSDASLPKVIRELLDFLNSHRGVETHKFPNFYNIDQQKISPARLAWCQGDIGIGNSIINCGRFLGDKTIEREGFDLLEDTLKIPFEQTGVLDYGICHGSSGVLLQYFLSLKGKKFLDGEISKFWLNRIEEQTENYTVFKAYSNDYGFVDESNILEGASGLGLLLLVLSKKTDTSWVNFLNLC